MVHVVVGVEDAEDVNAGRAGLVHEGAHYVRRVAGVADGVLAAQEHLQADVGEALPETGQPLPRVLVQEPERDVERRPAPHLGGEELGHGVGDVRGGSEHVEGPHPGGEQRLVGVAHRRVGHLESIGLAQPAGEAFGAEVQQSLPGARRRVSVRQRWQLGARIWHRGWFPVRPVDGDVGEQRQEPARPVGAGRNGGEVRPLVDKRGGRQPGQEVRFGEHRPQESHVRRHAAHPKLGQSAASTKGCGTQIRAVGGDLHQERVEVGCDLRASVRVAAVQPDARPTGRAVHRDTARVRPEALARVFGGHAALQRHAALPDAFLGEVEIPKRLAPGDAKLGVDQVHVGRFLGDGVLHLDARVHLDEYMTSVLADEEFDRAGAKVVYGAREANSILAKTLAQHGIEIGGRGDFEHLLVSPLDRAVPLEQVDDLPSTVGQYLHLDVARPYKGPLQEHRRVAERALGLACCSRNGAGQILGTFDQP